VTATELKTAPGVPQFYRGVQLGHRYDRPRPELELWWADERKPCVACKIPTNWRRPTGKRGAATHHACESNVHDTVTDDLYVDALVTISSAIGVADMVDAPEETRTEQPKRTAPLGDPQAGCSIPECGRGYSAYWIVAQVWLCPAHASLPIRYRR
jgi:hypothetical protein